MTEYSKIEKRGYTFKVSEFETLIWMANYPKKGRMEKIPLTDEDRAAHARAKAALEELEGNPWVYHGYEPDELKPLEEQTRFIPEETDDEWLARWKADGMPVNPSPFANILPGRAND